MVNLIYSYPSIQLFVLIFKSFHIYKTLVKEPLKHLFIEKAHHHHSNISKIDRNVIQKWVVDSKST